MSFGSNIKKIRKELDEDFVDFAKRISVSPKELVLIEREILIPDVYLAFSISKALLVNISTLVFGDIQNEVCNNKERAKRELKPLPDPLADDTLLRFDSEQNDASDDLIEERKRNNLAWFVTGISVAALIVSAAALIAAIVTS